MPLYWFLLVITALGSDAVPAREVPVLQALLATFGLWAGWGLLAHVAVRAAVLQVRGEHVSYLAAANAFSRQMELLRWFALLLVLLALVGFGTAGLLDRLPWACSESLTVRGLLLLIPGVLMTVWSWHCELRFEQAIYTQVVTRWPQSMIRWWNQLAAMFRMQGAWLIAPILLLLATIDVSQWLFQLERVQGAYVGGAIAMVALPLALPHVLTKVWKLHVLPDQEQREWLQGLVGGAGVRGVRLQQWDTEESVCTAMVAGFVPYFRSLLLSDALLLRLSRPQLAMVVLHELAHIRRRHLPQRLAVLVPVWAVAMSVTRLLEGVPLAEVAGIVAGLLASMVALRWIAYRTEYDADRYAVEMAVALAGRIEGVPLTRSEAGSSLASALLAVTSDHPQSRRASWMHPSIDARCQRLRNVTTSRCNRFNWSMEMVNFQRRD